MAAFYQTFVSTRNTEPDPGLLFTQLRVFDLSIGVNHDFGSPNYIIKKLTAFTPGDISTIQNIIDTAPSITLESIAQTGIDNMPIATKALLLVLLDQINLIRSKLPTPLVAITPAQAIQAVRDKAGTL